MPPNALELQPFATYWTIITDFTSDINLLTHAQGLKGQPCREIVINTGAAVVVKPNGSTETIPASLSGIPVSGQISTIKKTSDGTTATAIIVYW